MTDVAPGIDGPDWEAHYAAQLRDAETDAPPDDVEAAERDAIEAEQTANTKSPKLRALSVADVLEQWRAEGPLIHEPTGIAALDELTDGGPVYGSRWYLVGAPDAWKTAFLIMLARLYAGRGVPVGLLAIDEEPGDVVTRLAQRAGWARHHAEARDPSVLADMAEALSELPIRLYDAQWSIEGAAADLHAFARSVRADGRAMLGVDSLQTVTCARELAAIAAGGREPSMREAVTWRAQAIRDVASCYRMISVATSEMNRAAYRTADAAAQTDDLASAAESRAVEYSARVVLALRNVAGESDLIEVRVAKNKHGPRTRSDGEPGHIYLRTDRRAQTLTATSYEPPPAVDAAERRDDKARARQRSDAGHVAAVVAARPGLGVRDLRAAVRTRVGAAGRERVDAALDLLGKAVVRVAGANNGVRHYLDGRHVPANVVADLNEPERTAVQASQPPAEVAP